jgi:transmembrane sensor
MQSIDWDIIYRKINGQLSSSEEEELQCWLEASDKHRTYFERAEAFYIKQIADWEVFDKVPDTTQEFMRRLERRTLANRAHKILRWAAVFLIPLMLVGGWMYVSKQPAEVQFAETKKIGNRKPDSDKAVLITSSGKEYELDSGTELPVEEEDGVKIRQYMKAGLKYEKQPLPKEGRLVYNTLRTAKRGDYQLELADGTTVYLNGDSEIKYPVKFGPGERRVELKGEAFFEVTKNGQPFVVKAGNMAVEVMGTRFNVNAYADEASIKTTLVSGKVKIHVNDDKLKDAGLVLNPGQQASLSKNSGLLAKKEVDTDLYTSWISGYFRFDDERLEDMMRTISRWYGVEVYYQNQGLKDKRLTGKLYRFEDFNVITCLLEKTSGIEITRKNNVITIEEKK